MELIARKISIFIENKHAINNMGDKVTQSLSAFQLEIENPSSRIKC